MKALYFIRDSLVADASIEDDFGVDSIAYFCCTCGEIWARIVAAPEQWHVVCTPCEAHSPRGVPDWDLIPGSVLSELTSKSFVGRWAWASTLEVLPPAILRRELEVHINHVERQSHECSTE